MIDIISSRKREEDEELAQALDKVMLEQTPFSHITEMRILLRTPLMQELRGAIAAFVDSSDLEWGHESIKDLPEPFRAWVQGARQ